MDWAGLVAQIAGLPGVIDKVIDFFSSLVQSEVSLLWGVNEELQKLKRTVERIHALLSDAEERRYIEDENVRLWLRNLKDVAFDAEDLLDEVETQVVLSNPPHNTLKRKRAWYDFSALHSYFSDNPVLFKRRVANEIVEIRKRFDEIAKERGQLRLTMGDGRRWIRTTERPPVVSFPTTPQVLGRDQDRNELVNMLLEGVELSGTCSSAVISIVGIGGLGKTTLAQYVYNDQRVVDHFLRMRIWVCVTKGFDVIRITREILESVTGRSCGFLSLDLLQRRLRDVLSGRRFLLVLDNVGDDGALFWEALRVSLIVGGEGSKVLITTRNKEVSRKMGTVRSVYLKGLSDEYVWSLFEERACPPNGWDNHPHLKKIGQDIITKCQGSPLAAMSLGGLLRSVTDEGEWKGVLNEVWAFPETVNDILPTLNLSYQHLPLDLKKCLNYCAVLPNGYEVDRDELVKLWMAEGLIQPKGRRRMETIGDNYFNDLLWRSFFQTAEGDQNQELKYKMPSLIHDLVVSNSRYECSRILHGKPQDMSEKARYSLLFHQNGNPIEFQKLYRYKRLRTFLLRGQDRVRINQVPQELCIKLIFLRVLDLSSSEVVELPNSVGNLKHLRYLGLYNTRIERLPESVSSLCNLQTLELGECYRLLQLPSGTCNLLNLRHLGLHLNQYGGFGLISMPPAIGKLTSLQTLSRFVVGTARGCGIGELKELNIRGELCISKLENVVDVEDVREANLKDKQYIHSLTLQWSNDSCSAVETEGREDIIESLRPHTQLKHLRIDNHNGASFPLWMGDPSFSRLLNLRLSNCRSCVSLPSLRQLSRLKNLYIEGLHGVRSMENMEFPHLEIFVLWDMPNLERWSGVEVVMPHLNELDISDCPNLRELPNLLPRLTKLMIKDCEKLNVLPLLPSLQDLVIEGCNAAVLNRVATYTSLSSLTISHIPRLKSIDKSFFQSLIALRRMKIGRCKKLVSLANNERMQDLIPLESLEISSCPKLTSFSEMGLPVTLRDFRLCYCYKLDSLPGELHNLNSLQRMEIRDIPLLASLPDSGVPPALQYLAISGCDNLKQRCQKDEGEDWPKIQHIPSIEIDFQQISQS